MSKAIRKTDISFFVETVTPAAARQMLNTNATNRPVRATVVARYARVMRNGEWQINGEAIKFDTAGTLLDGQHRLQAIIDAETPVELGIVRNLPRKVFDTLDTGRGRSLGDTLAVNGEPYYSAISAALRLLAAQELFGGANQAYNGKKASLLTTHDLLQTLEKHPGLRDSVEFVRSMDYGRLVSHATAAYCHYAFSKFGQRKADIFFKSLSDGIGLEEGDPILALRNKLIILPSSKGYRSRMTVLALMIKAFNFYLKKEKAPGLVWRDGEEFPKIGAKL